MFYIWLVICSILLLQTYADNDDCGSNVDLRIFCMGLTFRNRDVFLDWKLYNSTTCSVEYRLTIHDEDLGIIYNEYLDTTNATVSNLSNCVTYNISVRAMNKPIPSVEGPPMSSIHRFGAGPQAAPVLGSLEAHSTSVNMTFILEGELNRCPLKNFYVDGGKYFNLTIPLHNSVFMSTISVEVTSLEPNTTYELQASVENSGGLSHTTPLEVTTLEASEN